MAEFIARRQGVNKGLWGGSRVFAVGKSKLEHKKKVKMIRRQLDFLSECEDF